MYGSPLFLTCESGRAIQQTVAEKQPLDRQLCRLKPHLSRMRVIGQVERLLHLAALLHGQVAQQRVQPPPKVCVCNLLCGQRLVKLPMDTELSTHGVFKAFQPHGKICTSLPSAKKASRGHPVAHAACKPSMHHRAGKASIKPSSACYLLARGAGIQFSHKQAQQTFAQLARVDM